MTAQSDRTSAESLFISSSTLSTEGNKTGSWRFLKPRYDEKTSPCSAACPAGEDIGRIEMLTSQGQLKEAWETILQENPFPGVCGRVCYHPCETVCNRGHFDEPIAIQVIERFLSENAVRYDLKPSLERLPSKKQKIAVMGAGPSGLAAAYFLSLLGYTCDVFESKAEAGGMLRFGIPNYRLPLLPLRTEIERMTLAGFAVHLGKKLSEGFFEKVRGRFDAVFVGCGLSRTPHLAIPGEDLEGVEDGLSFLGRVNQNTLPAMQGLVAVLGGGNTAIDVARSVMRLGAKALIFYRRRRQDMPAFEEEIQMALEEGVELRERWSPVQIQPEGEAFRLTVQQMRVMDTDQSGKAQVEPIPGKTESLLVTRIFKAIGLEASEAWHNPPAGQRGFVSLTNTVLVPRPEGPVRVYGGDLAISSKSVVQAVASGKEAALALDTFFQKGPEAIESELRACQVGNGPALSMEMVLKGPRTGRNPHLVHYEEINPDHFHFSPRIISPRLLKKERVQSFAEINLKISADLAMREAKRCFNCGLCNQCDNCRLFCPDLSVIREETPQGRRINYDYCKGCGICVVECPRNAMVLEEEQ
jgi:2-oxoacid:acceptor oxidoreductase delta subunit (pyruvate/2-ketoisovalerate family)